MVRDPIGPCEYPYCAHVEEGQYCCFDCGKVFCEKHIKTHECECNTE